jgi:GH18 family chitinase
VLRFVQFRNQDNFAALITEMGAALRANSLQFSAAVNAGFDKIDVAYDVPVLMEAFDFVNLMTYDYHGYWDDGRVDHR